MKNDADAKKDGEGIYYGTDAGRLCQACRQKDDEKTYQHLQELAVLVSNNSNAQEYLQAFIRWNQVAADLQKIVSDAMAQGMDVLELDKK